MATAKQLLANKNNARKSTGPKSAAGKLKSSQNAIKHGLCTEKFMVIGEKVDELDYVKDELTNQLKPIGIHQEIIVSKMIDVAIRMKRVPIIEAGILNHEMLEYEADTYKNMASQEMT